MDIKRNKYLELNVVDTHIHTDISPDSQAKIQDIVQYAKGVKLKGIILTNHFECYKDQRRHMPFAYIEQTCVQAEQIRKSLSEFYIGKGIEIGQIILHPEIESKIAQYPLDCLVASVHKIDDLDISKVPLATLNRADYLEHYFEQVYRTVAETDFDILAHLDLPARRLESTYYFEIPTVNKLIRDILTTLIGRGKTLEINTSQVSGNSFKTMPSFEILQEYFSLGGRNISLGSDAHRACDVGKGFLHAIEILQRIGFTQISWYKNRIRYFCDMTH